MTTENNCVIDISERLKTSLKERQKDDGVMFNIDRSSDGMSTHIEVYASRCSADVGINITIGNTSTLVMLTAKKAGELGRALLI